MFAKFAETKFDCVCVAELLRAANSRSRFDSQPLLFIFVVAANSSCCSNGNLGKRSPMSNDWTFVCDEEDLGYWFAVPKARADDLRSFCANWMPKASDPRIRRSLASTLFERKNAPRSRKHSAAQATQSLPSQSTGEMEPSAALNIPSTSEGDSATRCETEAETNASQDALNSPAVPSSMRHMIPDESVAKEWEVCVCFILLSPCFIYLVINHNISSLHSFSH